MPKASRPPTGKLKYLLPSSRASTSTASWMALSRFGLVSREARITTAAFAAILLLGFLALRGPPFLRLDYGFLAAGVAAAWFGGGLAGFAAAMAALFFISAGESRHAGTDFFSWSYIVSSASRFAVFCAAAWLTSGAAKQWRQLKFKHRQDTAHLQSEIQQHKQTAELLREAIELWQQVTEHINDVFWVTDAGRTYFEFVSPGFERIWGRSCESLYSSPSLWVENIHPKDQERLVAAIRSKQLRGSYDEEYRVLLPDGSVHWVRDRAFPVKDAQGAVFRIIGITQDITVYKRAENIQAAQRDMAVTLSWTTESAAAGEAVLQAALVLEGIDCGAVYLLEARSGSLQLVGQRGLSESLQKRAACYSKDSPEARLASTSKVTYLRADQIPRSVDDFWGSQGLRALAVVPVRHKALVQGMLLLGSFRMDEIPSGSRVGIELLASHTAGGVARIRAEALLRQNEAHVRSIVKAAPMALLAVDAGGEITFEDGQALHAMGLAPGAHLHEPAAVVFEDFPLMLQNLERARAGEEFSSLLEFPSAVLECQYAPLRVDRGRPGGCIAVAMDVTERFRLQRQVLEISDREQARIGQDVHDGLCQQLIGMAFAANTLEQSLTSEGNPNAVTVHKIRGLLDEAIDEARRVCRGLYPIRLRTHGLVPALEELAASTTVRHGIQCVCEANSAQTFCNVSAATHLYRIAQEAVNNAVKHSGGQKITVRLTSGEAGLSLSIHDDGKGTRDKPSGKGGMGMHIMDYRARLIGGQLTVSSGPNGTSVACLLPQLI